MLRQIGRCGGKGVAAADLAVNQFAACAGVQTCRVFCAQTSTELLYQTPVDSLQFQRQALLDPLVTSSPLRRAALRLFGYYSRESRHMRAGQALLEAIQEQADAPSFSRALQVPGSFQHQHAVLVLHVWLVLQRLRSEGKDGKHLGQAMYDGFQDDVEKRARATGAKVRFSKFLKEYEEQFYGSSRSYDRAMEGQTDLAAALARNVYMMDPEKQEAANLMARYVRREIACLALTPTEAVMEGNIKFSTGFYSHMPAEAASRRTEDLATATTAGAAAAAL
uniref:Ubiquinol-cytochrome c chaperone domain-containing protein n=1 Tax=Auxenochlorella protothecoides TaxID=3075 RepID=A0A1D1ZPI9_AUXPR